jgi:hypothetical protein
LLAAAAPAEFEVREGSGVRLGRDRVLQPDVMVALAGALTADMRDAPSSAVRAVVKVMSSSSVTHDRVTKPTLYAEAGIPTYIRIEPSGPRAPVVYIYRLAGKAYREHATAHAGQRLELDEPFPVSFDPAELTAPK